MTIIFFILVLAFLILVHELGHFAAAKLFNIRVEEFGLGLPPRALTLWRSGDTAFTLNWTFFGGFVRIYGEDAPTPPHGAKRDPRSFAHKHRVVQAAVVAAGVACNLLFAWLLFSVGYMAGLPTPQEHGGFGEVVDARPLITAILPQSPAERAGMPRESVVLRIETGRGAATPADLDAEGVHAFIGQHPEESMLFTLLVGEEEKVYLARPQEGLVEGRKAVGIEVGDFGTLRLPPHLALAQGALMTARTTLAVAQGLASFFGAVVRGVADFSSVAGPIGIVSFGAAAVGEGFVSTLLITALISINLALINLLPIPGLDGGRLLIIGLEGLLRRAIPAKLTATLSFFGLGLLILLMIVVSFYDIARLSS